MPQPYYLCQLSTEVLELLLDEDEDVPDVWYMLGWANYLQGADYAANARHYLSKARQVMDYAANAKHCLRKARIVDSKTVLPVPHITCLKPEW